jgi:oligoendopeptidase F
MNIEELKFLFQIVQFLLTGAIGVYVYLSNADKVNNERIAKLESGMEGKIDDHAERMATLEQIVKTEPTHADMAGIANRLSKLEALSEKTLSHSDLAAMYEKINHVHADVSTLQGEFVGVRHLLSTINEFLMKGGKS